MNLVNDDFSIKFAFFKCKKTGHTYRVSGTENTFRGDFWNDHASKAKDTIIRSDGVKKIYDREELKKRFTNVEATGLSN